MSAIINIQIHCPHKGDRFTLKQHKTKYNFTLCLHGWLYSNMLIVTNKIKPVQHCYKMHDIYLENVTQEKYLRVILHRKLSWKPHVSSVVAKANLTRYFLQQNLSTCSRNVKLKSYKTYARPIVEYASTVWDPNI